MTYKEQLQDERWKRKRKSILVRDENKCRICGMDYGKLEVHHLVYLPGKLAWEYDDKLLITLCDVCHSDEHIKTKDFYFSNMLVSWLTFLSNKPISQLEVELIYYFMINKSKGYTEKEAIKLTLLKYIGES